MDKATTLEMLYTLLLDTPLSKKEIADTMWLEEPQVEKLLTILRQDGRIMLVDGKYTGIKKITPKKKKPIKQKAKQISYIPIIRYVLEVIGIAASILSVRYTAIYLLEVLPVFWAWFLSGIMIVFSVMAFQMVVIFFQKKHHALAITFGILWIIVAVYSMGSTVIGQYNARREMFVQGSGIREITEGAKGKDALYAAEERTIEAQIESKQKDLARYNTLIAAYDTIEKRDADRKSYNALASAIYQANLDIEKASKSLSAVRTKRLTLLEEGSIIKETEAPTFYVWISAIFGWNSAMVEFIISIIPSIWIDIIAPLGVAIGLFLKEDE